MWLWKWVIGNLNPYTGSAKSYFESVTLTAEAKNCKKNINPESSHFYP